MLNETRVRLAWRGGIEPAAQAADEPALIKAGLAHLWLVTLHPFDDGNGRIARAVGDQRERKAYYDILERTQKQSLDVTE